MTFDPNNPTASGMVLTFDDEFNSANWSDNNVANHTIWNDQGINNPSSLGTAVATPGALSVGNGVLTITAQSNGGGFNSGMLQTVNSAAQGFAQKYGYFEADIKIPPGQAAWPAFFLYSQPHFTNGASPSEIDILEGGGSNDAMWAGTIHDGMGNQNGNNVQNAGIDLSQGFHRYGMLWDPNSSDVTWYLDGREVMTAPKFSDTDAQAEFMALQLQLNNNNTGTLQMQTDYVRVYQFANQNPTAVQAQAASPAAGNNDPVAHVNALGQSGTTGSGSPAPAPTPSPSSSHAGTPAGDPGSGSDSLSVRVSGDHWVGAPNGQPDPQFVVLVDGHQVGGVQTVQAVHDAGQWQDITLSGSFANPQQVDIRFLNDQYGGSHAQDINLYVDSVTLNGHQFFGSGAQNSGSQGYTDSSDPNAALMTMNGDAVFNVAGSGAAASGSTAPTATATVINPTFSDGAGHDIFVFKSAPTAAPEIANFQPNADLLDLAPLLKNYTGTSLIQDHIVTLVASGTDSTKVMFDPTGHDPNHGTALVTLDHVLPQSVHDANFLH